MKKRITLWIALIMTCLLTGCGQSATESDKSEDVVSTDAASAQAIPEEVKEALTLKHELRFNEDGSFRILVVGDVQKSYFWEEGDALLDNIATLVDRENPDLVLFIGDNSQGIKDVERLKKYVDQMVAYIESKQIPWAHVFGNHDAENDNVPKDVQQAIYESHEYCVSKAGDEELSGIGNYVLPVLRSDSDTIGFNVWALDSGDYRLPTLSNSNYNAYIRFNQVMWYYQTSELLEQYNGAKIPAMMFFHIALQESRVAWENREDRLVNLIEGQGDSGIGASEINSGLFAAALDRGDVKLIVNGHIHRTNMAIEYAGIKLCYTSVPGMSSMRPQGDPDVYGARVIVVNQDDAENVETYMSYIEK